MEIANIFMEGLKNNIPHCISNDSKRGHIVGKQNLQLFNVSFFCIADMPSSTQVKVKKNITCAFLGWLFWVTALKLAFVILLNFLHHKSS